MAFCTFMCSKGDVSGKSTVVRNSFQMDNLKPVLAHNKLERKKLRKIHMYHCLSESSGYPINAGKLLNFYDCILQKPPIDMY